MKVWMDSRTNLPPFFVYSAKIRKVIYTTKITKVTKIKGASTSDQGLVYQAFKDIAKKLTMSSIMGVDMVATVY